MIILGLHFGHDAAVSVVEDGRTVNCIVRERRTRVKHALGLDAETVTAALDDAGLGPDDIDLCALTSTQAIDLISLSPDDLSLSLAPHPDHVVPSLSAEHAARHGTDLSTSLSNGFLDWIRQSPSEGDGYRHLVLRSQAYFPEHATRPADSLHAFGAFDRPIVPRSWLYEVGLEAVASRGVGSALGEEALRFGMHLPVTVRLMGHEIGGYLMHHHLAHAASVFYPSGLDDAVVLTHDGWRGLDAVNRGLFWFGRGSRLYPLAPHYLSVGALYEQVGYRLGLGAWGQEGKLMGLAPYGRPVFHDPAYVGNLADVRDAGVEDYYDGWFRHCLDRAAAEGYELDPLADPERITDSVNADIAASTQMLFEETMLRATRVLHRAVAGTEAASRNLCLAGGTALNCPANSRIWREGEFDEVLVPPWTDDSGLALGAALALYHSLLGEDRGAPSNPDFTPYVGRRWSDAAAAAVVGGSGLERSAPDDPAAAAARDLAGGLVVGWYEGRSEVGPRALGHRSIVADPRCEENWRRVNRIKGREWWRPLAPAVLEERAPEWFEGCPLPAPHMLFTARVRSADVPAVTHVDGSARVQTVGHSCGLFRRVLEQFDAETGCPVIVNTSLNGPGEPIVESPEEALAFYRGSALDVLYLDGWRLRRT